MVPYEQSVLSGLLIGLKGKIAGSLGYTHIISIIFLTFFFGLKAINDQKFYLNIKNDAGCGGMGI